MNQISNKREVDFVEARSQLTIKKIKEMICSVCKEKEQSYRCPQCKAPYCSVPCYKKHIQECDKKGEKAEGFVEMSQYSEKNLRKDFDFLSEMLEKANKAKKSLSFLTKNRDNLRFKLLASYAKRMFDANYKASPFCLKRHMENKSFVLTKKKSVFWTLEFLWFTDSCKTPSEAIQPISLNESFLRILIDPVDVTLKMEEVLKQIDLNRPDFLQIFKANLSGEPLIDLISQNQVALLIKNDYTEDNKENKLPFDENGKENQKEPGQNDEEADQKEETKELHEEIQKNKQALVEKDSGASEIEEAFKKSVERSPFFLEVPLEMALGSLLKRLTVFEFPTLFLVPKTNLERFLLNMIFLNYPS